MRETREPQRRPLQRDASQATSRARFGGTPTAAVLAALLVTAANDALATEWFVDGALGLDSNPGSTAAPFATIGAGLDAALAGDTVTVRPGTYGEQLDTVRDGAAGTPIVLRAETAGTVVAESSGNVLHVLHAWHVVEGLAIDGLLGPGRAVNVETGGSGLVLRDVEIRNSGNNCIDLDSPDGVLIERASIHHCLLWDAVAGAPADAHGITGTGPTNLTVRDSEIYYCSGDAIQLSPPRAFWDALLVERTTMWTGPLPAAAGLFPAGTIVGENAFDSKTPASGPRPRATFIDVVTYGYTGFIGNQGAFNVKENVEVVIDRATVSGSEIAFRVRAPALATIRNAVTYGNEYSLRYEDGLADLRVVNVTFADPVAFVDGGGGGGLLATWTVSNAAFAGVGSVPPEASGPTNLVATAAAFVDAAANDYRLSAASPLVDVGEALADVTVDRIGVARPFGTAYDVGAYEWAPGTDGGAATDASMAGTDAGATTGSDASGAPSDGGNGDGGGGCRCAMAATRRDPPAMAAPVSLMLALLAGASVRRRNRSRPASS